MKEIFRGTDSLQFVVCVLNVGVDAGNREGLRSSSKRDFEFKLFTRGSPLSMLN